MAASKNQLFIADNLNIMHGMNSESVDLIYLDPPFNSKRIYSAPIGSVAEKKATAKGKTAGFDDIWNWNDDVDIRLEAFLEKHSDLFAYIQTVGNIHGKPMKAYLTFIAQRVIEMHRILKSSGSLYLHCDPTANSYLRILLDYIFGRNNMRNEIVWSYRRWSGKTKAYQKMHDSIFFYVKNVGDHSWNWPMEPKAEGTPSYKRWNEWDDDKQKMVTKSDKDIDVAETSMRDVWEVARLQSNAKERVGYPTQKPLALLNIIIKTSSNAGDIVMDPFCGCATTCVAAQNLGRNWIGIDVSDVAVDLVVDRLSEEKDGQKLLFSDFVVAKTPPIRTDQEQISLNKPQIKKHLYDAQRGKCNGCKKHFDIQNFAIDHIYPKSLGGADVLENLQLLCGHCNSTKGNRPMEYLLGRIKARKAKTQFSF